MRECPKADKDHNEPNTNGFPAHQPFPENLNVVLDGLRGNRLLTLSYSLSLSGGIICVASPKVVHDIYNFEQAFLGLLEELLLLLLFELLLCHVSLPFVFLLEVLINLLHLLCGAVELECNDPGGPLSGDPVYELECAHDYDRPDGVKVSRVLPPGRLMDCIYDTCYRYEQDKNKKLLDKAGRLSLFLASGVKEHGTDYGETAH